MQAEHGDALTADFQQFYGLDLGTVWTGELKPRRALALAEQLVTVVDSRLRARVAGFPGPWEWVPVELALTDIRDFLVALISGLGGKKASKKQFYPRPEVRSTTPKKPATVAEFGLGGVPGAIHHP